MEPLIHCQAVGRVFASGAGATVALDRVTFEVGAGDVVAVVGPSGSGKTTLLSLIGGLDVPTSGTVSVEGRDLSRLSEGELSRFRLRRIGFVFQLFNLIPVLSAAENVELPLLFRRELAVGERRRRVEWALDKTGLATRRGRRPCELSGGEQQRVAIARALAGGPAVVLADEPTAHLDRETGRAVIALMQRLSRENRTSMLYATHDPELLELADRVITLRDGRRIPGDGR